MTQALEDAQASECNAATVDRSRASPPRTASLVILVPLSCKCKLPFAGAACQNCTGYTNASNLVNAELRHRLSSQMATKRFVHERREEESEVEGEEHGKTQRSKVQASETAQPEREMDERGVAMAARRSILDGVPSEAELSTQTYASQNNRRGVIAPSQRRDGHCDICGYQLSQLELQDAKQTNRPETLCISCRLALLCSCVTLKHHLLETTRL